MFDFGDWKRYRYHYLVIIIVVIIILWFALTNQRSKLKNGKNDGEGSVFDKGRGSSKEDIETLLNRIDWSTYLYKRIGWHERFIIPTLIAVGIIILVVYKRLPSPVVIILLLIIIYISFLTFSAFFYFHGDMYNDFYIKNNVDMIRDKLKLYSETPPDSIIGPPTRMEVS